jgi:hypothetical protein
VCVLFWYTPIDHLAPTTASDSRIIPAVREKPALEKQICIDSVHNQTIKIVLYTKDPRNRVSPRHGGQGVFFEF